MNRPNVLPSRNLMLKNPSYSSKPSPMEKPPQRGNTPQDASYACVPFNSNAHNPFIPVLSRISDPPPMPVQLDRTKLPNANP